MGLKNDVELLLLERDAVAFRPSQTYTAVGAAYTIFTIVGGAVQLKLLVGRRTGAAVAATTLGVTVAGIGADAGGAILGGTALNGVVWIPLNVAGTALGAAALPATVATLTYMLAGTGNIVLNVGGVNGSMVLEWAVVYKRLSPVAEII